LDKKLKVLSTRWCRGPDADIGVSNIEIVLVS